MSKRFALLATAAALAFAVAAPAPVVYAQMAEKDRQCRRRADVSRRRTSSIERGQFQRPHHPGRRRERPPALVDTLSGPRPVHRVRADQCGLRQIAGRYWSTTLLKPENKATLTTIPHLSRGAGPHDRGQPDEGRSRTARAKPTSRPSPAKTSSSSKPVRASSPSPDAKGDVAMVTIADVLQSNRRHPCHRPRCCCRCEYSSPLPACGERGGVRGPIRRWLRIAEEAPSPFSLTGL